MDAKRAPRVSTPRGTTVNSANPGVWPGSLQPEGLIIRATLAVDVAEFARPMNSSMTLGGWP